jgi:hypothetical protein
MANEDGDDEIVALDPETIAMLDALRSFTPSMPVDFSISKGREVAISSATISKLRTLAQREPDKPDNSEMLRRLILRAHRKMRAGLM